MHDIIERVWGALRRQDGDASASSHAAAPEALIDRAFAAFGPSALAEATRDARLLELAFASAPAAPPIRPPRPRQPHRRFVGSAFRGKAHMLDIRSAREKHRVMRDSQTSQDQYAMLADAWDAGRLRAGDCAERPGATVSARDNEFRPEAMLRSGRRTVGKNRLDREGVGGLHNCLVLSCGVAGAVRRAVGKAVASEFSRMLSDTATGATVIRWHYDTTPWGVQFGGCYERLFPSARYPRQDGGKWRVASRDACLRTHPNARMTYGCLDVMAQRASVDCCTQLDLGVPRFFSRSVDTPPIFLQIGKASTIHAVVDSACDQVSLQGVRRLLQHKRFVIIGDCPGNAGAMRKRQAFVGVQLSDAPGALWVRRAHGPLDRGVVLRGPLRARSCAAGDLCTHLHRYMYAGLRACTSIMLQIPGPCHKPFVTTLSR